MPTTIITDIYTHPIKDIVPGTTPIPYDRVYEVVCLSKHSDIAYSMAELNISHKCSSTHLDTFTQEMEFILKMDLSEYDAVFFTDKKVVWINRNTNNKLMLSPTQVKKIKKDVYDTSELNNDFLPVGTDVFIPWLLNKINIDDFIRWNNVFLVQKSHYIDALVGIGEIKQTNKFVIHKTPQFPDKNITRMFDNNANLIKKIHETESWCLVQGTEYFNEKWVMQNRELSNFYVDYTAPANTALYSVATFQFILYDCLVSKGIYDIIPFYIQSIGLVMVYSLKMDGVAILQKALSEYILVGDIYGESEKFDDKKITHRIPIYGGKTVSITVERTRSKHLIEYPKFQGSKSLVSNIELKQYYQSMGFV